MLYLDGEERDGRNFLERLMGNGRLSFGLMRATLSISLQSRKLVEAANEKTANDAQEKLVQMLGVVVCTQIMREGNVCERVNDLALLCNRQDIVPTEIRQMITGAPGRAEDLLPPRNLA
jgi:hypothetical protein